MRQLIPILPAVLVLLLSACATPVTRDQAQPAVSASATPTEPDVLLPSSVSGANPPAAGAPREISSAGSGDGDVWTRIRDDLSLSRHVEQRSVQDKLAWYRRHQDYLDRVAERAAPYLYFVVQEIQRRNMPIELALLPIVESAYHPFAYSPSRAAGLWQFIPSTGKRFGLKQNWWYDGRRDVVAATRAALDYLQKLHDDLGGDWLLALAAYNAGEKNIARAVAANQRAGHKTDFWSLHLPRETRGYVPSLLAVAELLANASTYGTTWQPIPDRQYFAPVQLSGQIDLATAASLAGMSMEDLYTLNPGFNQWATDPDGPHSLLVPVDRVETFQSGLQSLPEAERISWNQHVVRRGETLSQIATRYHTSVDAIKQGNKLRNNLIRVGQSLLIPSSRLDPGHYSLSADSRRLRDLDRDDEDGNFRYVVQKGDTLWDIGRKFEVSVAALQKWNGVRATSVLRPGQQLKLQLSAAADPEDTTAHAVATEEQVVANGPRQYTVRNGDSLWLIARRFGISVAQLEQWNDLPRSSTLQPGQTLIIDQPVADAKGA